MNDLKVEMVPTESLILYARNARKIPESAVDKVAASIKEFGWRQPIVIDRERVVIVGHTRLMAAKKLGYAEVPVHAERRFSCPISRIPLSIG
jgi:ParB-like chromosome segregation protein Spo0J